MMGDLRVEAVTRTMESPLGNRSQSVPKWKLPTGEPYAGKPPVRFGGRGGESLPYPYSDHGWHTLIMIGLYPSSCYRPWPGFRHPCRNDEALNQTENCCLFRVSPRNPRLSSKGQVILPKSVRDAHHWSPGIK